MGAHTPACLYAASDPVETVTPPNTPCFLQSRRCEDGPDWLVLHQLLF